MAVVPGLFGRRTQVVGPAVRQLLGAVVEAGVLLVRHQVMVDGRFQEVAGGVALVIAASVWIPVLPIGGVGVRDLNLGVGFAIGIVTGNLRGDERNGIRAAATAKAASLRRALAESDASEG